MGGDRPSATVGGIGAPPHTYHGDYMSKVSRGERPRGGPLRGRSRVIVRGAITERVGTITVVPAGDLYNFGDLNLVYGWDLNDNAWRGWLARLEKDEGTDQRVFDTVEAEIVNGAHVAKESEGEAYAIFVA